MKKLLVYLVNILTPVLVISLLVGFDFKMRQLYGGPFDVNVGLLPPIMILVVHILLLFLLFVAFNYVHANISGRLFRIINALMLIVTITTTVLSQAVPAVITFFEMTGLVLPMVSGYFAALAFLPSRK